MKTPPFKISLLVFLTLLISCSNDDNGGVTEPEPIAPANPVLMVDDLRANVAENPNVTAVVAKFTVTQENLVAPPVYELLRVSPIGALTINTQGELLIADATIFDFERRETVEGDIRVSSGGLAQNANFRLDITNVDEAPVAFITKWDLPSSNLVVQLPLYEGGQDDQTEYDFRVDWGDGSEEGLVTSFDDPDARHTYTFEGIKTVTITGTLKGFNFLERNDSREEFIDINQWGDMQLGNAGAHFLGCFQLKEFTANDTPRLKEVTNMSSMFDATSFNGNLVDWNVSSVTNMSRMFNSSSFNGNISSWNVSNVTNMEGMFERSIFNGDISSWDVSNVTNMEGMFSDAKFDGDISSWDVSKVTTMAFMFNGFFSGNSFNGDISNWNTSSVTNMRGMFNSSVFNNDISGWTVSNVTNMEFMFSGSTFNGNISSWDVSNVTNMEGMFRSSNFNGDISNWNTSSVTNMEGMFERSVFNSDISGWDVSNVTNMEGMFFNSAAFNGDISNWNVSNVITMRAMFGGFLTNNPFNGNISNWDVSNVSDMASMFGNAQLFNSDISGWDVSNVTDMGSMFSGASSFNSDISDWNVSNVTEMRSMFREATIFNQDLSDWSTEKVTSCADFATGSALLPAQLPTQGPCFKRTTLFGRMSAISSECRMAMNTILQGTG
ncbi:MAG: BspA family leucine-rich repeat surface protein [Croceivirga sp.]